MKLHTLVVVALVPLLGLAGAASADYQAGMDAYQRGDYQAAAEEFAAVVRGHSDDARFAIAFHMLGLAQLELHDDEAAIASLGRAAELNRGNAEFALALGQALLRNEQSERAFTVLTGIAPGALPDAKRTPHALLLASAALKTDRGDDAVAALKRRAADAPGDAVLARALGSTYAQLGRRDEAFAAFAAAFSNDPDDTDSAQAAVKIGLSQAAATDDASVREALYRRTAEVAAALAEHAPGPDSALLAGEAALGASDFDAARGWFEKVRAERPHDPVILAYLGQALGGLGRDDEAVAAYEEALTTSPEPELASRIFGRVGAICASRLDFDHAIQAYRKAGNNARAAELTTVRDHYRAAVAQRRELTEQADKLEEMAVRLDALGEQEGAATMRGRAASIRRQIAAIDDNLARVRAALQQG